MRIWCFLYSFLKKNVLISLIFSLRLCVKSFFNNHFMQENSYQDFNYTFNDADRRMLAIFIMREATALDSEQVELFVEYALNTLPTYCALGYGDNHKRIGKAVEQLMTALEAENIPAELNSQTLIPCLQGLKSYLNSRDFPYTANVARSLLGFTWVTAAELLKKTNHELDNLIKRIKKFPGHFPRSTAQKPVTRFIQSTTLLSLLSSIDAAKKPPAKNHSKSQEELMMPGIYHFTANKHEIKAVSNAVTRNDLQQISQLLRPHIVYENAHIPGKRPYILFRDPAQEDVINKLLAEIATLEDAQGVTVLATAITYDNVILANLLLDMEVINGRYHNHRGFAALIAAILRDHLTISKRIIDFLPSLINMAGKGGNTPIFYAITYDKNKAATLLLDTGMVNLLHKNQDGATALMQAARKGNVSLTKQLIRMEPKLLELSDNRGFMAPWYAISNDQVEAAILLLDEGNIYINHQGLKGETLLMLAALKGQLVVVEKLLNMSALVNLVDENGMSALMQAVEPGHIDVVKKLLNGGADIYAKNKYGHTALMLARTAKNPNQELIQLLEQHRKKFQPTKVKPPPRPSNPQTDEIKKSEPIFAPENDGSIKLDNKHSSPPQHIGYIAPGSSQINTHAMLGFGLFSLFLVTRLAGPVYNYCKFKKNGWLAVTQKLT